MVGAGRQQAVLPEPRAVLDDIQSSANTDAICRVDEIAHLTPALCFIQANGVTGNNNGANIVLRGVTSNMGPPARRSIATIRRSRFGTSAISMAAPVPRVFELEGIAVPRKPKGRLFGVAAGAGLNRQV